MKKPKPEDYGATVFRGIVAWHDMRKCNDYQIDLSEHYREVAEHYEKALREIAGDLSVEPTFSHCTTARKAIKAVEESK